MSNSSTEHGPTRSSKHRHPNHSTSLRLRLYVNGIRFRRTIYVRSAPSVGNRMRSGCINYLGLGWLFELSIGSDRAIRLFQFIGTILLLTTRKELGFNLHRHDSEGLAAAFLLPWIFFGLAALIEF